MPPRTLIESAISKQERECEEAEAEAEVEVGGVVKAWGSRDLNCGTIGDGCRGVKRATVL